MAAAHGEEGKPKAYVLGADDVITIQARQADDLNNRNVRIGTDGLIHLPMIGAVRAAGRTAPGLATDIEEKLRAFFQEPEVVVSVVEMKSQPVSVLGLVHTPGVYQLNGRRMVTEVIAMAGGIRADAGDRIRVTRRAGGGDAEVREVSLKAAIETGDPAANIEIQPNDVVSVPKARMVYVIGDVKKPGAFVLSEREQVSVLEALSMAEGMLRTAAGKSGKILRSSPEVTRRPEQPIDLTKLLAGKEEDLLLRPDDILFVPSHTAKNATMRILESAIQIGTGITIYRGAR
ncbi:MAG: polysaccharide biosynthesis/export family protein [Bryobacteraceae bacterium]